MGLTTFIGLASGLDCPDLTCASVSVNGVCFTHEGNNPVVNIKLYSCPNNMICNIDDYNYAWYDTQKQKYKTGVPEQSALPNKYTTAQCITAESRRQNLNNGRKCQADFECKSKYCEYGFCRGAQMGETCANHEDCDVELACKAEATWPFTTSCQRLGLHGDPCSTDFDCHPKTFCWYKYPSDIATDNKMCLDKYS